MVGQYAAIQIDLLEYPSLDLANLPLTIDDQLFFETLKMQIRGMTIAYSSAKKKERETAIRRQEQLLSQSYEVYRSDPSEDNYVSFQNVQNDLQTLREPGIEGVMARAKARWALHGERNTRYFCNLERRHYTQKSISHLIDDNGQAVTDIGEILEMQRQFYENLYRTRHPEFDRIHQGSMRICFSL